MFCTRRNYLPTVLRLVVCPLVMLVLLLVCHASSWVADGKNILMTVYLAAITPACATVTSMAQLYDRDAAHSSALYVLTTLLSIITMPVMIGLFDLLRLFSPPKHNGKEPTSMNRPKDEGLNGNEKIEQAVYALQQEATQEQLAHTLTVIRRRMKEHGQFVVAVEPNLSSEQMQLRTIRTADGASWWYAFTSFEEELKGAEPVQSTFLVDMDKLFDAALAVPEISGIILNPWNRTIQLDKTLIRITKGS